MKEITSFDEWQDVLKSTPQFLLFVKTNNCSVCEGLYPQVAELESDYPFGFYRVNAAEVPEMAGQLALFTAPVVLLFHEQKELARFARIVPMNDLKKRLDELVQWRDADE
ncbi:thiol reductase thioredoxin [Sporosarcina sp. P37]|uniref:thioredoxin family protein n=1 Tax=unclassified Sporosarcina TaxID=2647733 RepID=UPI0009BD26E1|nr:MULTISPECIES: thioredoxin family protein [unclassified Sporosarcina]ARD46896.1 thiol reductase thioredoxin [Sporosarcina sp. P33]ARK23421.1 thiol reductase thioredoxin [Sporosarcina sp. P37]PID18631.1 thioredoxin [Sporosarcina sp. P35]